MGFGVHGSPSSRTYVSNTGSILPAGQDIRALGVEQVGFFKVDKSGVGKPDRSVLAPTAQSAPSFRLGIGRNKYPAQQAVQTNLSKFPLLTQEIKASNIIGWRGTKAENEPSTEIYTVGYDGVDASKRLHGVLDYKELIFQIRLWGTPIKKLTGVRKELIRQYYISKGCIDKCLDVCEANPGLADELIADDLIKQIKADKFNLVPITDFVKVTKLRKSAEADPTITGLVASTKFSLSLCDDGSASSLGAIQSQYPGYKIEFASRVGSTSTYSMWRLDSQGDPASFVNTAPVSLAVCDVCPSGYTLAPSVTVYTVERPVTPTTDLSTSAARQTYADSIGTAYAADTRGINTLTGTAGTGYTNGTHALVFTGGGGTGATGTVTVAGGAITARTVTNKGRGYTSAPTVTFPAAGAGTGGTVVATITAAPTVTSSFVGVNNGTATVFVSSPQTFNSALAADSVSNSTTSAYCVPPAGANVAWTEIATATRAPKQYMITLGDDVCGNSRLTELQGAYPELVISEEGTVGNCARVYLTTTYSDDVEPDECAVISYEYTAPDGFQRNVSWTEYVEPLENPVCTTEEEETPCVAAGVKFETAVFLHNFSECAYGYYNYHLDDVDPVYMEISAHTQDWTASPCYFTDQIVTKLRGTKFATGSGRVIREQERSTLQYEGFTWTQNPAINDAYGVHFASRPETFYDTYHLSVETNNNQHMITGKNGTTFQMTYTFAFPAGTGKAFESLINSYIVSLGKEELQPVFL